MKSLNVDFNFLKVKAMKRMKFFLMTLALFGAVGMMGQGWIKYFAYQSPNNPTSFVTHSIPRLSGGVHVLAVSRYFNATSQEIDSSKILLKEFNANGDLITADSY
ncbi:MAG: hypothetical protein IT258_08015, partial [Saprospiraceae bacterium]|nr:hypothetical protein [Saprospiraceae bacterium]